MPNTSDFVLQPSGQASGTLLVAAAAPLPVPETSPLEELTDTRAIIRGVVAEVLKSDKVIRINLGAKAPQQRFAAVIYPEAFAAFPNVDQWDGQMVEIRGPVVEYGGRPQILLKSGKQLAVLKTPTPAAPAGEIKTTGKTNRIRGVVAEILKSPNVIRINLGAKYPDRRATALIYPEHFAAFPQLDALIDKAVEIVGEEVDLPECPHVLLLAEQQITVIAKSVIAPNLTPDEPPQPTGKTNRIRGLVAEVLKTDKVIRIHIGDKAPYQRGTAAIYPANFAAFPAVDQLVGQTVEITGAVLEYGGGSQILLQSTNQVVVLASATKPSGPP